MKKFFVKMSMIIILLLVMISQMLFNLDYFRHNTNENNPVSAEPTNMKLEENKYTSDESDKVPFYEAINKFKNIEGLNITSINSKEGYKEINFNINTEASKLVKIFDFLEDNDIIIIRYDIEEKDSNLICNILGQYKGEANG
ncbi:hypothetical protein [Clostridium manihotivorum]|uniref:Uncharacterized protein n=1 Tax=Clostridium manihotivorum TaxID=2320868 RepID=A0A410DSG9_9CLOT|nr:hypothetical protein [Clostridium manihotivorum]QAA32054.1 hypothetical protein C1I91_10525 [Clostridium manihotivorum]